MTTRFAALWLVAVSTSACVGKGDGLWCTSDYDCVGTDTPVCDEQGGFCIPEACTESADCFDTEQLCARGTCGDPDVVTGGCPAADELVQRSRGGPIIVDATVGVDPTLDAACTELDSVPRVAVAVEVRWHDPDGDVPLGGAELFNALRWAEAGGAEQTTTLPVRLLAGSTGVDGNVIGVICFDTPPTTEIAVQLVDAAGNRSNAACGPLVTP